MDIHNLKQTARARLDRASCNPRRLALIHTAVALAVSVALTVIHYVLDRQIGNTGGLSGIGTRSVLTTVQTVLQAAASVLLPFWQIGFLAAALAIARGAYLDTETLGRGFRNFRSVLRFFLMRLLLTVGIAVSCIYLSTFLFMMTPMADQMMAVLEPAMEGSVMNPESLMTLDPAVMDEAMEVMWPASVLALLVFGAVMIPVGYCFRLGQFVVLEDTPVRGFRAILTGFKLVRRNFGTFFRLDLQFWWYYLLQVLILTVGYGDEILRAVGVNLPVAQGVSFFGFFGLQVVGQLILLTLARPVVDTTYAVFYEELKTGTVVEKTVPQKMNWDA